MNKEIFDSACAAEWNKEAFGSARAAERSCSKNGEGIFPGSDAYRRLVL